MITLFINNHALQVPTEYSVLEACESVGLVIPRFCYHERLNVAGNCRMCLVEIEKITKPVASCAFPVAPGLKIFTNTPLVQKARENVLEFLLINHPLDCPICDQGGECDLQDQTLRYGSDRTRFFYPKRKVSDKKYSPFIKMVMSRCIHCTRCVRFFQDIVGISALGTTLRGAHTEIGMFVTQQIRSPFAGNIIDLCPVGALTSKAYAFQARAWEVKTAASLDIFDSFVVPLSINFKETEILRILPLVNDALDGEWITDRSRFFFDALKVNRMQAPFTRWQYHPLQKRTWERVINDLKFLLHFNQSSTIVFECSSLLDLETLVYLTELRKTFNFDIRSEEFYVIPSSLVPTIAVNHGVKLIETMDACFTFGLNIETEASLLNLILMKRFKQQEFNKFTCGLGEPTSLAAGYFGNAFGALISCAEGKHTLCQQLVKIRRPVFFIGTSVVSRVDALTLFSIFQKLSVEMSFITPTWNGLNFIPIYANSLGALHLLGATSRRSLGTDEKLMQFGLDLEAWSSTQAKVCVDFQTSAPGSSARFRPGFRVSLPVSCWLEKEGHFLNFEHCLKVAKPVLVRPAGAHSSKTILEVLFRDLTDIDSLILSTLRLDFNKLTPTQTSPRSFQFLDRFTKQAWGQFCWFGSTVSNHLLFKNKFSNPFVTISLTKSSALLAKGFSITKQNFNSFL